MPRGRPPLMFRTTRRGPGRAPRARRRQLRAGSGTGSRCRQRPRGARHRAWEQRRDRGVCATLSAVRGGVILLGAASAVLLFAIGSPAAAGPAQTFSAIADGYVTAAAPGTGYGRARSLRVAKKPAARAYLRFRIARLQGDVAAATLRVFVTSRSRATLQVRAVAPKPWNEQSLRYRGAPRLGRVVATAGVARGWRSIPVSGVVPGTGTIDLALVAKRGSATI